jgi:hypothetical protein
MNDHAARRGASFSSAFSIILSLARERIAELGCRPVGENPKAFVDRGGLRRLETEAAEVAIRRVREAAYPLIFKLFGDEMPHGKERKLILTRLGQDLGRIEKALGYRLRSTRDDAREGPYQKRSAAAKRRRK